MNAIRYRMRAGCSWRQLPHDFPPWTSVFQRFRIWSKEGVLETIHNRLRSMVRVAAGRAPRRHQTLDGMGVVQGLAILIDSVHG